MSKETYILFHSSNYAMWAADELKIKGLVHRIVPVPRELSSDCGYCINISSEDSESAVKILEEKNIELDRIAAV